MRLEIHLPIQIEVNEDHECRDIESYFKKLDKQIKVKVIAGACIAFYTCIVYTGSLNEPENALMVKKIKKEWRLRYEKRKENQRFHKEA